ncbi:MAG: hypothetical protein H0X38_16640 [Planctomycetes bacterium]|nr:hypothetical protein [Planctomycetota bacterium]
MTMTLAGAPQPARDQVVAAELSAKAEVLAIAADGREITTAFTVTTSTVTRAGVPGELLPKGTVITADSSGGKTVFSINGAAAAPELAQALEVVIHMSNPKNRNDDQIFGSTTRRAVGDSWPVDGAAAVADLVREGKLQVDPADFTGKTTVVELVPGGSAPALRISAVMELGKVAMPLPPGMSVTKGSFTGHFTGLFPVDVSKRSLSQSMSMDGKFDCAGDMQGKAMTMTIVIKQGIAASFTY